MKTPLVPYRDILTELKFEIAWYANLPHLTRERYEREEVGEGRTRGVLWVFLEANEAEVLWTMGWDSTSMYDMLASSTAAARQGLDPLTVFSEKLRGIVVSLPVMLDAEAPQLAKDAPGLIMAGGRESHRRDENVGTVSKSPLSTEDAYESQRSVPLVGRAVYNPKGRGSAF